MSFFVVDVESDGPIPGDYSMHRFAAVRVDEACKHYPGRDVVGFVGKLKPISDAFDQEALDATGYTRDQIMDEGRDPEKVMREFVVWLNKNSYGHPVFISDNNGFDWMFMCWYLHHFTGENPFGFSSRRIGDIYAGLVGDAGQASKWKRFRRTEHDHNPLNDAVGNAQAILHFRDAMNLRIDLR